MSGQGAVNFKEKMDYIIVKNELFSIMKIMKLDLKVNFIKYVFLNLGSKLCTYRPSLPL